MEGRYPNGLLVAITNCSDPEKEDEFNYWYNHIHLPDLTAPGVYTHALRFANTDPLPGEGHYFATYETTWEDLDAARKALLEDRARLIKLGRRSPLLDPLLVGFYRKRGGEFCAARKPVTGVLAVFTNCKDPARVEEFNTWYTDVHVPDILNTGAYHTAYLYESMDTEVTAGAKYLQIFETHYEDPAEALADVAKVRPDWDRRGRFIDTVERAFFLCARRIWPTC